LATDAYGSFGERRPSGVRRRTVAAGAQWWRIDSDEPSNWDWSGFPKPHNRFDPGSGAFRTRYGAATFHGAARERYSDTGRYIPADHAGQHVVHLVAARPVKVLDLRTESNIDALAVDDRISTGREKHVQAACRRLVDCCRGWWDELDGVVYRSRTTPESSANLAFFDSAPFRITSRRLDSCSAELDDLILRHEFTIGFGRPIEVEPS
jgi:RES domain-containing protein